MSGPNALTFWPTAARTLFLLCGLACFPMAASAQLLDLDGDTDRNGQIEGSEKEERLEKDHSVIVINNCDRDETSKTAPGAELLADNRDSVINGDKDKKDMEPVILRRAKSLPEASVKLVLQKAVRDGVPLRNTVRVFGPEGREILGPSKAPSQADPNALAYELSQEELKQIEETDLTYYVEGLCFGTQVKLSVQSGEKTHDELLIEAAPFLLTPHNLKVQENYVVLVDYNRPESERFVKDFSQACKTAGVKPVVIRNPGDVWIEDEICWGYTASPRQQLDVALHMPRLRELERAKDQILKSDLGWTEAFSYSARNVSSLTYGGNVEVTPPTAKHPFGCVYYGSVTKNGPYVSRQFDKELQAFFHRQQVQPVIDLHTDWLTVGHIDELISFVPKPTGGFALVVASPTKAYEILDTLPKATPLDPRYSAHFFIQKVDDLYREVRRGKRLRQYNEEVDRMLFGSSHLEPDPDSLVGTLKAELGFDMADVIEVPVVFVNDVYAGTIWSAEALNPDLSNLSSMGSHVLLGEQFFEPFQKYVEQEFADKIGVKVEWIDNWKLYHTNVGGVHCGSNERRQHFAANWWDKHNE